MTTFVLALILIGLSLFGISMRKTYDYMPRKELKRLARNGDAVAAVLYRAVAYGASLRLLLWLFIGLTAAGGFILLTYIAPPPLVFLAVAGVLLYGFAWMPTSRVTDIGARMVLIVTPLVAWLLSHLHPLLSRMTQFVQAHRPITFHTGLFEREDLIELLEMQRHMPDTRISPAELDLVIHALSFGEVQVQVVMVPRRAVVMVASTDVVGPILMDELHAKGHSRFPVYGESKDEIIGTLHLRDLLSAKHGGTVADVVQREVYYIHEDETLFQVLHAFIKTKHHLFIVVNSFEEIVGIITIEDVLEQVIGRKIEDEFDTYDDIRAVVRRQAKREHAAHKQVLQTEAEVVK